MNKLITLLFTVFCTIYSALPAFSANRFWIAGSTANWNSTANWSTTSGGSSGASVPGSGDVAKFDGNGTGSCTIDATVNVAGVDIASGYTGTIAQGSYVITVGSTGFIMVGGTFTGGSAKIDINSTFTLSAGSFTATSDTLYIGGNSCGLTFLTHSGGTFSHNNGTVTLDPNQQCSPYYGEINIITSTLFYNIRIATPASNTPISVSSGDTVKAANNIEHSSGYLHGSCWSLLGNLTVGSNAGGGTTGQIIFTGTNTQTYAYGSAGRTGIITINKASGTVSAASGTTGFAVKGLKIVSGDFTAPSGDFYISGTICNTDPIFNQTGGGFSHNNGRVIFDVNQQCSPYYATINVNTSTLFYDIKIAGAVSASGINVSSGDTVKAAHNLEHDAGYLGGSCWSLQGNLTVGSNAGGGSSGQIIFTGTNTQTYTYGSAGRTGIVTINKSSGTVGPASGTTGFAAKGLKIVSGSFTAPSGDFYISGTVCTTDPIFDQTGGTFSHNNGRVIFDANQQCSPYYATINVNSSTLFYDVKIAGATSASQINVSSGDTVKAAHDLEHASGYIMGSCWSLQGNFTVGSNAGGGNGGQIIFTGTNTQTYAYGSAGRTGIITVNKASGTVSAASGTTDFAVSGFKQSSATFNAPSGNFFIGGFQLGDQTIFDQTGGTFNPNSGIVVFDPYSNYNYKIKPYSTLFYKVTAKPVGYLTLHTSSDTLKVANNLKLEQGYFNTGVLAANAKVTVNSGWNGGSAQLLFCGTTDQDFDLTGATDKYNGNIKIKKPSGKVNLLSAAVLDQSSQTLTFVKGDITTTATNLLTIGHGVTVSGASDSSHVDGPIKKIGTAAFTYPVGKNGHYRMIGISAPANTTDAFTAEYFEQNSNDLYSHSSHDVGVTELSRNEYWNLARTTGSSTVNVTMSWDTLLTSCTFADKADLKVAAWDGSTWKDKGNGGTTGTIGNGTVVTSSASGVFGAYAVGTTSSFACRPGTSCEEALDMGSGNSCINNIEMFNNQMWFSFTADSLNDVFLLTQSLDTTEGHIHSIYLFEDGCSALNMIAYDTVSNNTDTLLILSLRNLELGNKYYVKIEKVEIGCSRCANNEPFNYNVCIEDDPSLCVDNTCSTCQHNSSFTFPSICSGTEVTINAFDASTENSFILGCFQNPSAVYVRYLIRDAGSMAIIDDIYHLVNLNDPNPFEIQYTFTSAGTYLIQWAVTEQNHEMDCVVFQCNWFINIIPGVIASVQTENISCYGEDDGEAWLYVDGDIPNTEDYDIEWLPNGTGTSSSVHVTHLAPGNYSVIVTAANGCEETIEFTITEPDLMEATIEGTEELACFGDINGTLTANPTGGTPPYTYYWSTSETTSAINGLVPGEYSVYIEDAHGCKTSVSQTITEPTEIQITITSTPNVCGGTDGQLIATVTGGTPDYQYHWSPSTGLSDDEIANPTVNLGWNGADTDYTLTVTDANGCEMVYEDYNLEYLPCCTADDVDDETHSGDVSSTWGTSMTGDGDPATIEFAINGNFTIDNDFIFYDCDILLGKDARVSVLDGQTLTITSDDLDPATYSHLYACGDMWNGIYVMPDAKIVVNKGSLIEDAKIAVWSHYPGTNGYIIDDAVFNKNYIHFLALGHPASTQANPGSIIKSDFLCQTTASIGGTPDYNTTLKPPYENDITYIGVLGMSMYALNVGDINEGNVFDNGYFGVSATHSNVNVVDNEFHNYRAPDWCSGITCILDYGMCVTASTGDNNTHSLYVTDDNDFYDSNWGVHTYNNMHLVVDENDFTGVRIGVAAFQSVQPDRNIYVQDNEMTDMLTGIWCADNKNAEIHISGNIISIDDVAYPNLGTGIAVHETIPLVNTRVDIEENTVSDARNGIWVSQMNGNTYIQSNTVGVQATSSGVDANGILAQNIQQTNIGDNLVGGPGTDWWRSGIRPDLGNFNSLWCNTAQDIGRGLFLSGEIQPIWIIRNEMIDNQTGIFFNWGPLQDIGNADYAFDNTWSWEGDNNNPHTDNISGLNLQAYNLYYRDNETGPPYRPTFNNPIFGLGINPLEANDYISNWEDYDCPTENGSMLAPGAGDITDAAIKVLEDDTELDYYEEEGRWMARAGLYIKTLSDATLRNSDGLITDFYDSCATANIGKLVRANNALAGWYFVSEMGWYPTMDEEAAEEYLDTLTAMTTGIVPEDALRDVLKIGLEKYLDESTIVDSMSYKISGIMHALLPDSTFEAAEVKNPYYTTGQLSALVTIAEQCPYEYGPAVFMARAMLSKNDTIPYPYYHACEASPEPASFKWEGQNEPEITANSTEEEIQIKVYPNPSENELYVQVNGIKDETMRFELWTTTGQKVKVLSLQAGVNKLLLTELSGGLYNYIIYVEDVRNQSGKHVIITR